MDFSTTPILYYKMSTSNLRLLYLKFPMGTPRTMLLKNGGHTACQRSYIDLMFGANDGQAAINLSHFCIYSWGIKGFNKSLFYGGKLP